MQKDTWGMCRNKRCSCNTGRPTSIELRARSPSRPLRGSSVGRDTQIHCEATTRNSQFIRKSLRAPPPTSSPLPSPHGQETSREEVRTHSCLLTVCYSNATSVACTNMSDRKEESDLERSWTTKRADADFTDYWMMRQPGRSALSPADFQDPRDDVERGIWWSLRLFAPAPVSSIYPL